MPLITELNQGAFSNCKKLNHIECPELTTINDYHVATNDNGGYKDRNGTFAYCVGLKEVLFPKLSIIGQISFYKCTSLENVDLPNLTSFYNNNGWYDYGYPTIGAFYGCTNLKHVNIPKVTRFFNSPFYGCSSLESIELPSIESYSQSRGDYLQSWFGECTSLKTVTLGKNLPSIPPKAFYNCTSLTTINCLNTTPPSVGDAALYGVSRFGCTFFVPEESIYKYGETTPWNEFYNIKALPTSDTYFDVAINVGINGSVTINGETVSNSSYKLRLKGGEDYTISITPDNGYQIQQLLVDGNNVTSEISSNSYIIKNLSADITISATFETIGIYLTINQGEGGVLKQKVFSGSTCTFSCIPSNSWKMSTATYNGNDISSQLKDGMEFTTPAISSDSELRIVYESAPSSNACATPTILVSGNAMTFECETPGAEFTSYLTMSEEFTGNKVVVENNDVIYTLTVYAIAPGYDRSQPATMKFVVKKSDVNGDGRVDVADIATIIDEMAAQARRQEVTEE